ncbi:MAG TPA: hypothetical protein VM753_23615, partial [Anaeromyxobacter sp.]|nr:hypothetical protein [Anaeromyxobacter sp.]
TQLEAFDREAVQTVTKDLTPEKRARAMLFLDRLHNRFGPGGPPGMRGGPGMRHGPGHGPGGGMGPGQMGMGSGMGPGMMAGGCSSSDCAWNDGPDDDD